MSSLDGIRIRRSIDSIWDDYVIGQKLGKPELQAPLNKLIRAWIYIQGLDPSNQNSFFNIGGMHGEPFRGAGYGSAAWWGGWCNHGNVLFPTWHRAYMLRLEDALRAAPGCEDVTLPYWDETSEQTAEKGVPEILLMPKFNLEGVEVDNPLYSFKFNQNIVDNITGDDSLYTKPKGYETVRYPFSGLVGTDEARAKTKVHNEIYQAAVSPSANDYLNNNVKAWLKNGRFENNQWVGGVGVRQKYINCLAAPNYTVFSNTTSAQAWNDTAAPNDQVTPLEAPHNDMHLAVGGFDIPNQPDFSPIEGANGDMGENDTAGLDPIFYFHHCFIDRQFWLWQVRHGQTEPNSLSIIDEYPGTNSVDNQGPTPGVAGGTWLTLESPLQPFVKSGTGDKRVFLTSRDVVNIETQLNYAYDSPGSGKKLVGQLPKATRATHSVRISGINRNAIAGSHQLIVYGLFPGEKEKRMLAVESVLSRWHTTGCKNCQTTSDVKRFVQLYGLSDGEKLVHGGEKPDDEAVQVSVEVVTRLKSRPKKGEAALKPVFKVVRKGQTYSELL